jgi:hypothetical protein
MIHNLLSSNEITELLNNPIVQTNKDKLSVQQKVDFSIQLPDAIKTKLETGFGIDLSQIASIPLRWIKGDTPHHVDRGENHFNNTHLLYLTDSIGNLIIDGQSYPIAAGNAHIFSEGLAHSTINTGDSERLMIGPMSETGFRVGAFVSIIYFNYDTEANQAAAATLLDPNSFPDTTNAIGMNDNDDNDAGKGFEIKTVTDISSWYIATNIFGTEPSPNGGPYTTGTALNPTGIYYLYSSISPPPPSRLFSMRSLFTDNAKVYYKPGSLSTGGGGSGVTNSRIKQRRT